MEFKPLVRADGPRRAGELVEVVDPLNRRYERIGRVAYFVGDNVYVSFGRRRWSPKHMFFTEQLRAVVETEPAQQTVRVSRLRHSAAWLRTRLHLP